MSNPTADALNGKQVSPPPYTPLTGPAGDAVDATRGESPLVEAVEELFNSREMVNCAKIVALIRQHSAPPAAEPVAPPRTVNGRPVFGGPDSPDIGEHLRALCGPVAVEHDLDEAVVLGRIRAVVDAWVSPLLPRGEAAGQMLEAVRPYLRVGAGGAAVGQGVEWMPIETAPKNGTGVRLKIVHPNAALCTGFDRQRWIAEGEGKWIEHNGGGWTWAGMFGEPTHWQPLPPKQGAEP